MIAEKKGPIRILHVLGILNVGGAESRIMDLYRKMDRTKVQFDFLVHGKDTGYFEEEIQRLGGRVYRVPKFKVYNYISYRKSLEDFFAQHHDFAYVQGHMTSTAAIYLPIGKRAGVLATIAHARSAGVDKGIKGIITKVIRRPLRNKADYLIACSREAGIALYGLKKVEHKQVRIIPNAIEVDRFSFQRDVRERLRLELGLTNYYVVGHTGRFHYAKNHSFLIEIFAQVKKQIPDSKLLLVGDGQLQDKVREQVNSLGLTEDVLFAGRQSNISDYYQAMDYVVFPSFYEGLPGTVVEAQTTGLRCLLSEFITKDVAVTDLVAYCSLQESSQVWADYVVNGKEYERIERMKEMRDKGFDVVEQVKMWEHFYLTGEFV